MITVYSRDGCEYCEKAKGLLNRAGIPYTEVEVLVWCERQALYDQWGLVGPKRGMPQIFIDDERVGGYDDLLKIGADQLKALAGGGK